MRFDANILTVLTYVMLLLAVLAASFQRRRTAAVVALLGACVVLVNFFWSHAIETTPVGVIGGPLLIWMTGAVIFGFVVVGAFLLIADRRK